MLDVRGQIGAQSPTQVHPTARLTRNFGWIWEGSVLQSVPIPDRTIKKKNIWGGEIFKAKLGKICFYLDVE